MGGAVASLSYVGAGACKGLPRASVGLVGPWWQADGAAAGTATAPSQAFAAYGPGCARSDASACIYGAGCGAQRAMLTAGGNTTRSHSNASEPLWPLPPPPPAEGRA